MISDKNKNDVRLDVMICDLCKEEFADEEECYELSRVKLSKESYRFETVESTIKAGRIISDDLHVKTAIRFHNHCFRELSGDDYMI